MSADVCNGTGRKAVTTALEGLHTARCGALRHIGMHGSSDLGGTWASKRRRKGMGLRDEPGSV